MQHHHELDQVPARHDVALRVLDVAGNGRSSATDLANALQGDPAMTAQVLRLANSAYYGMAGRVRGIPFAVTVIGFSAVRGMAATYAAGAAGPDVPRGFWERAAASAASSSVVAARVGASRPDGFTVGLLHELGDFLLYRRDPQAHARIHDGITAWDCRTRCRAERELFGTDHGEVLGASLREWFFPEDLVDAYITHGDATRAAAPLARTLVGGQALASLTSLDDSERMWVTELVERLAERLEVGEVEADQAWTLSRHARLEADSLVPCLALTA